MTWSFSRLHAWEQCPYAFYLKYIELTELYKIIKNSITLENLPDGDFYELEIDGKKCIVNENDILTLDGKEYLVKDLLDPKN